MIPRGRRACDQDPALRGTRPLLAIYLRWLRDAAPPRATGLGHVGAEKRARVKPLQWGLEGEGSCEHEGGRLHLMRAWKRVGQDRSASFEGLSMCVCKAEGLKREV